MKTVLVVDDIDSIRVAIKEYLSSSYRILEASNGREALRILGEQGADLVLTDIRMPELGGLELIEEIRIHHPESSYILMTAYNVNDYIQYARIRKIWNIIPKTSFLNLSHIRVMVDKLLGPEIFGVKLYAPGLKEATGFYEDFQPGYLFSELIENSAQKDRACHHIDHVLRKQGAKRSCRQILDELTANAAGAQDPFFLRFALDDGQVFIVTEDFRGNLRREDVLYSLERQVQLDPDTGLPIGVFDHRGRGLHISREQVDHLVFNIAPGERTEVIAMWGFHSTYRARAISIYQKERKSEIRPPHGSLPQKDPSLL
ncbi:MAG: response regulator [Spirochaetales bacterium]|nr:response regulator [Spirochaetales bacterium]